MTDKPIEELLALRYASICDKREFSKIREIISDDFTQTGPDWHCDGAAAFEQQLDHLSNNFSATMHLIGNQIGGWKNGVYTGETYCIASHIYEKDNTLRKLEMAIRYDEEIRKDKKTFKYSRRDVHPIWVSDNPLHS